MVIEHVFVTTVESTEALSRAAEYLAARGFMAQQQNTFAVGQEGWTAMEMHRGKKNPARARGIHELPQAVRVEWDRGRVTVAASIGANAVWGGGGIGGTGERPRKMEVHRRLLMAITYGLEELLAHDHSGQTDYYQWDALEVETRQLARKRKIRTFVLLGILAAIILGIVLLAVLAAAH